MVSQPEVTSRCAVLSSGPAAVMLVRLELVFTARPRRHPPLVLDPVKQPGNERIELMKRKLECARELDVVDAWRPKTRADCADVPRPCPLVSCRCNLHLDVDERGVVTIPTPDVPLEERQASCVLDVIGREPDGLERHHVGALLDSRAISS